MPGKPGGSQSWSGGLSDAQLIDRELGRNPELRSGVSAYSELLRAYQKSGDKRQLSVGILDHAARQYRKGGVPRAKFVTFNDGAADFLFDLTHERTILVWGLSRTVAPGTRDKKYHAGFSAAGKKGEQLEKGHAWAHAQGGREGGPNYFPQARRLNQEVSENGHLWREIEKYLAANAGLSAFIRLIYAAGNEGFRPNEVEYGILPASGQFRAVIFPNS